MPNEPNSLSLNDWQICEDFRQAWSGAARPKMAVFLDRCAHATTRPCLFWHLLEIELELRQQHGEQPRFEDYQEFVSEFNDILRQRLVCPTWPPGEAVASAPVALSSVTVDKAPPDAVLTIPGYEILGKLGAGGMGVVYKARQVALNRVVALKMVLDDRDACPEGLARFRGEAQALARLQHPNIVQVFDVSAHDGRPYFSMEYVEGGSLDNKLTGASVPPRQAAQIVETLARAVHAAHEAGVVHRDLKPANILVANKWVLKITDFGLAKRMDQDAGRTRTGEVMGTPCYMAPEQAGNAKAVGPPADIHSLGAILYELLTGRPPFKGRNVMETLQQVLNQDPVPPRRLRAKTPRDLETICLKCLAKEQERRYASAAELADDLRRWLAGEPIKARSVHSLERAWRWAKRKPAIAGSLTAVAFLLVVAAIGAVALLAERGRTTDLTQRAEREKTGRKQAEEQSEQAKKDRETADLQKYQTQYIADIKEAPKLWKANDLQRLVNLLEQYDPRSLPPEKRDLIGFEWHHWWRLCHDELLTIQVETPVRSVAFSHDGKLVAGLNHSRELLIWDAATGKPLGKFPERVDAFAFSPTELRLAVNTRSDDCVSVCDVALDAKGEAVFNRLWTRNTDYNGQHIIQAIAFSPDGKRLAAALPSLPVWNGATGAPITRLGLSAPNTLTNPLLPIPAHAGLVYSIAFSPDSKLLASGGQDGVVKVWEIATGGLKQAFREHKGSVISVAFSPSGKVIASSSAFTAALGSDSPMVERSAGEVLVWHIQTKQIIGRLSHHAEPVEIAQGDFPVNFSPDDRWLLGPADAGIQVWDSRSGLFQLKGFEIKGHTGLIYSARFSSDGTRIVSSGADHTIRIWPAEAPEAVTLISDGASNAGVVFLPGSTANPTTDGFGRVWEYPQGDEKVVLWRQRGAYVSADGRRLAARLPSGDVRVCDAATGGLLRVFPLKDDADALALSADGRLLATGGTWVIRVLDVDNGQEVRTLTRAIRRPAPTVPSDPLRGSLVPPDSPDDHLTSVHWQGGLAFSPDGKRLAAAGHDEKGGKVLLWDFDSPEPKGQVLTRHDGVALSVAFSPDGQLLASGGADGVVRLWDLAKNRELPPLQGHRGPITNLAFSRDGQRLASVAGDRPAGVDLPFVLENTTTINGEMKLWEPRTGDCLLDLPCPDICSFQGLTFSPDGRSLAAAVVALGFELPVSSSGPVTQLKQHVYRAEVRVWDTHPLNESTPQLAPKDAPPAPHQPATSASGPVKNQALLKAENTIRGDWRIDGKELMQDSMKTPAYLFFGDKEWDDYTLELDAKRNSGSEGFKILFRAADPRNYYAFGFGSYGGTWHEVFSLEDGIWNRRVKPTRGSVQSDQWYKVRVEVRGETVRCFVDGDKLFEYNDDRLLKGQVGLSTWNTAATFRNIRVTAGDGKTILWEGLPELPSPDQPGSK